MVRILSVTVLAIGLSACQGVPGASPNLNAFDAAYLRQNIKEGQTTVADVRRMLGAPSGGEEGPRGPVYWSYREYEMTRGRDQLIQGAANAISFNVGGAAHRGLGATSRSRLLMVNFTPNGKVEGYQLSN